ncbi:hypothetical protein HAX54_046003, partial [Datura stramonium]|nr:hypothetical protein [Datura stramonium]
MKAARSNSLSKLQLLLQSPPIVTGRAVSTLSSPILKQSSLLSGQLQPRQLSPFFTSVRHFRNARDPSV